jgi:hypothetical protein
MSILASDSSLVARFRIQNHDYLWLIDTGASISALKYKHIAALNIPFHKQKCTVNGIGGTIEAIGYIYVQLVANGESFDHKIYIFNSLPCLADGIIGNDFLSKHGAVLDYNSNTLRLAGNSGKEISLPFFNTKYNDVSIIVPPRSESIHYINTDMTDECIVCTKELCRGVFLANTIVRPVNGVIPIKILNTTEEQIHIKNIKPQLESLHNYALCSFSPMQGNAERVKKLFTLLQLNHLNTEE